MGRSYNYEHLKDKGEFMYNKVTIIGNLGGDVTTKQVGEHTVAEFNVATSKKVKGQETTTWFRVSAWGKLAELTSTYLAKGRKCMVVGEVSANAYMKDNDAKCSLNIFANEVVFLSAKGETEQEMKKETPAFNSSDIPF